MGTGRLPQWRRRRDVALTWLATGVVVAAVYAGVMLLGRAVTGASAPLWLAILATGAVAAVIGPAQRWAARATARVLRGSGEGPYAVLAGFPARMEGGDAVTELPARMARLLAEATGARWAQVWLILGDRPTLVASHPATTSTDLPPPTPSSRATGLRSVTVGHRGELLGFLRLQEHPGHPLTPVEERLFAGLAAQAGLALHAARVRAELETRHADLALRAAELRAARTRLVAAQDEARRLLERDIHDGAQQQLVALGINLRLAQTLADRDPDPDLGRARELLRGQATAAEDALETLATLARGDRPRVLREAGLVAALRAVGETSPLPLTFTADHVGALPAPVEAALYFSALEAVQNAVKHAHAASVQMSLAVEHGLVRLRVVDDGRGITDADVPGTGRANLRERLAPLGGDVALRRRPEGGTEVTVSLPIPAEVGP
jgi:signal transduction histidine kinase